MTITATPMELWPPNGRMVTVTISGTASDAGSGVTGTTGAFQVIDEYGAVQPRGTFTVAATGAYSFNVALEARRAGGDKDGRHYTVEVTIHDAIGNATTARVVVLVPHDRGH